MNIQQAQARSWRKGRAWDFRLSVVEYILLICLVFCSSGVTGTEERLYDIDLPAQPVNKSLNSLSEQTGVPVLFPYNLAKNRRANPVKGRYTLLQALEILLEGTGLSGGLSNKGVLMISLAESEMPELDNQDQGGKTMSKKTGFFSRLTAVVLSAFATAQSVPAQGGAGAIEEVIVTAQKRAESIQDVPITMEAFSGNYLSKQNVRQADDIVKLAPNLTFNYSNDTNTSISIRGIGTDNFHGNVNRAVGVYYDEVYMATPYSGTLGVYDLERVEVLRGPQNTLFGRNTTGGAVRYISKKPVPGESISGYGRATYGRFDQMDFEGAVGVPLGDTAAARVSLQSVNRDGPFTNLAPGHVGEERGVIERHSARVQFAWEPVRNLSFLLNLQAGINRSDSRGSKARGKRDPADPTRLCTELASSENFESTNSCVAINGFNPSAAADDWGELYNVSSASADIDVYGGSLTIDYDFGWASITSVTSYYETDIELGDDITGINAMEFTPHQDSKFDHFSQEVRLKSPDDQPFRWIAGLYYFREDLLQGTLVRRDANGPQAPGGEVTAFNILNQEDEDMSIYGQIEADFTDKLTVTAGLRYTNNDKSADSLFGLAPTPTASVPADAFITRELVLQLTDGAGVCPPPPVPCRVPLLRPEQEIDEVGAKFGFNYRFNETVMGYASYSRGFKSGGFDTRALAAFAGTADQPVDPEILNAWEGGVKTDLYNNTLRLNMAAFLYKWKDQQTFATIGGIPGFLNIPSSELVGFESSIRWVPRDDWLIQAAVGLLDTEVTDAGGLAGVDQGHELKNAPNISFNGLISKDFMMVGNILNLQASMRYVDEQANNLEFANDFLTTRSSQFYLDARATYSFGPADQYEISVFGENLTAEKHCMEKDLQDDIVTGIPSPSPITSVVACSPNVGRPVYGVTATVRF